jgi:predicted nucleic acid-binding protein
MIVYLDTSSLVKLYVEEIGSPEVRAWIDQATAVATSRIAYAEARAAFARKAREASLQNETHAHIIADFERDWENYFIIEISEGIVRLAGALAEHHGLRGFDALHLASALSLRGKTKLPVAFSCFDKALSQAAEVEGLLVEWPNT